MRLGVCLVCTRIFTITDAMVNVKEAMKVVTKFQCTNCGSITEIKQEIVTGPTKKFRKADSIHV